MDLKLVKLEAKFRRHLEEMMQEWYSTGEKIVPYAIRKNDHRDFDNYLQNLEIKVETDGRVPDSTFFCLDQQRDVFVGAVNVRHYLNEQMLLNGGAYWRWCAPVGAEKRHRYPNDRSGAGRVQKDGNLPGADGLRQREHRFCEEHPK